MGAQFGGENNCLNSEPEETGTVMQPNGLTYAVSIMTDHSNRGAFKVNLSMKV